MKPSLASVTAVSFFSVTQGVNKSPKENKCISCIGHTYCPVCLVNPSTNPVFTLALKVRG